MIREPLYDTFGQQLRDQFGGLVWADDPVPRSDSGYPLVSPLGIIIVAREGKSVADLTCAGHETLRDWASKGGYVQYTLPVGKTKIARYFGLSLREVREVLAGV